jgi:hypothetical protein
LVSLEELDMYKLDWVNFLLMYVQIFKFSVLVLWMFHAQVLVLQLFAPSHIFKFMLKVFRSQNNVFAIFQSSLLSVPCFMHRF